MNEQKDHLASKKVDSLSQEIFLSVQQHAFGLSHSAQLSRMTIVEGRGVYLMDADGNWYLDLHAGPGVMSTGHGHPIVLSAVEEQLRSLVHCHDLASPARLELHERLNSFLPTKRRMALLSGGAESVELALRLARNYTGRDHVAVCSGGFHGKTLGALGCTDPAFREGWWCKSPNISRVPYAECYECSPDGDELACATKLTEATIASLERLGAMPPAALLIEPAQGTAGNVFPPPGFLKRVFAFCRQRGILIIADEILTGCGRMGKFLATEDLPIEPDILLLGKGLGSGYPIGAVLPSEPIASAPVTDRVGNSSTSYGGNPLAAAAAAATLRVIAEENLVSNSAVVGRAFLQGLRELAMRHEIVKNVRGRGLMLGFDLDTKVVPDAGRRFFQKCLGKNLMIMGLANRVRINPPLVFGTEHVAEALDKLDGALSALKESHA